MSEITVILNGFKRPQFLKEQVEAIKNQTIKPKEMKGWEDYDLWVRMMNNRFVGKRIPKPLFTYFHHEKDGTVSTEANKNTQELYDHIMNKNNIFKNENN